MKSEILFLKGVIILIGLAVLALCIFGLPSIAIVAAKNVSQLVYLPGIISLYLASLSLFAGLYWSYKILNYISKRTTFSKPSVKALTNLKSLAIATTIFLMFNLPLVYHVADADDAPGLIIVWIVIASIPFIIAMLVSILKNLVETYLH